MHACVRACVRAFLEKTSSWNLLFGIETDNEYSPSLRLSGKLASKLLN